MSQNYTRIGESTWSKAETINSELFTLTYGAVVSVILQDEVTVEAANNSLFQLGFNLGVRMIDQFFAESRLKACSSFSDTGEVLAKVAFKMFLGITPTIEWNENGTSFILTFFDNPITHYVEIPRNFQDLKYNNIICGAIKGALEQVNVKVEVNELSSRGTGAEVDTLEVSLIEILQDHYQGEIVQS
eukprot:TRINITY_DN9292_c0_g1_i1.p1 TRINITY_DN9292_c0_g1~~TRINITY_DN9292_c0_g1_i1.p1  ORF type:complete len:187 (+),score=52.28 TRINITY_DN9292_c0_g1_i1:31-591(+)